MKKHVFYTFLHKQIWGDNVEIKELRVIQKPNKCLHCGFEPVSQLLYGVHEIDEKMQRDIEKTQNELESKTYEGKSQLVTAVVGGNNKLISINIDVDSIEQDDKEMLEDMILVAVNNAIENMEKDKKEKLGKYSNMLNGLM